MEFSESTQYCTLYTYTPIQQKRHLNTQLNGVNLYIPILFKTVAVFTTVVLILQGVDNQRKLWCQTKLSDKIYAKKIKSDL